MFFDSTLSSDKLGKIGTEQVNFSFEFFPAKNELTEQKLRQTITRLAPLSPDFISVTYGAGGGGRNDTLHTLNWVMQTTSLTPVAHLTSINACKNKITQTVNRYWQSGIRHLMVLRGDMPTMTGPYRPHPKGYQTTAELVGAIKRDYDFEIMVSAYPEKHPESVNFQQDIDLLKAKIDAGATAAITQFALDSDAYLRFFEKIAKENITIPVIPGIMLISSFEGVRKIAKNSAVAIPDHLLASSLGASAQSWQLMSAMFAAKQCELLKNNGVNRFHLYTLNKAEPAYSLCKFISN